MALTGQDDGTVNGGRRVWLNAGGSTDPDSDSLTYSWQQTAGTTVTINPDPDGDADYSYFTAPGATSTASTLTFELTADDGAATSTAEVSVVVRAAAGTQPTNVAATPVAGTSSQIEVTWTAVADAQTYWVQYKSGSEGYDGVLRNYEVAAPATSQILYSLNASTQYTIRVIAINTAGFASQPSAAATATTPALPAGYENPPGSVNQIWVFPTTSLRPDGFQLFWYKPAAADADAYYAQWKSGTQDWDTSRQKLKLDCRTPYCTLDIRNLNGGTEYTVRVASVKGAYNLDTSQFTPSSDLSRPSPELVVTTPPYGEGTTTVTARSTYLEVTWDSSAGATHYELQWKSGDQGFDPGARGIVVFATDGPLVGSVITGLTPETEYTVRVIAFIDVHGDGSAYDRSYLVPVTATTTALVAGEIEPPAQVQGLTSLSSGVTTTQIQIRWDSTPNADGYIVQWKSYPQQYSDTERRAVIACDTDCQSSPTQTYAITGLAIGSEIEIQVTATRAGAINGTPSLILKVGTRPEGPPGNLRIWTNAGTVGLLEVAWNEVRGAASYRVQWVAPEESFDQSPPVHEEIKRHTSFLRAKGDPPNRRFSTTIDTGNPGGVPYKLRVAGFNINNRPGAWAGPLDFILYPGGAPPPPSEPDLEPEPEPDPEPDPQPDPDGPRPPTKPRNLSLVPGDGQIEVSWDEPSDRGKPDFGGYIVEFREVGSRKWLDVGWYYDTDVTIEWLDNGATYEVRVAVLNIHGDAVAGPKQVTLPVLQSATDGPRPPSKPRNLSLVPGDGQIEVSWDEPSDRGDPDFRGYIVEFREVRAEQMLEEDYSDWSGFGHPPRTYTSRTNKWFEVGWYYDTDVTIEWLENDVTYEVRVTVANIHGEAVAGPKRATPSAE